MSAAEFLSELRSRDIRVWSLGGELRCNARAGALTPELRDQLRERKSEILEFLASAQALAGQQRAIVPLQRHGERTAIFGVPGHNGDVFCYRALAQALGDDQPFFGLQPPGLDREAEPLTRVEDIAAYFAAQIRAFQPQGPYIIAGFCAGGTVAFELAQQLQRVATVRFIALFGTPYPAYSGGRRNYRSASRAGWRESPSSPVNWRRNRGKGAGTSPRDSASTTRGAMRSWRTRTIRCWSGAPRSSEPPLRPCGPTHPAISAAA